MERTKSLPEEWCTGLLTLLPKKRSAREMKDFRPITVLHALWRCYTRIRVQQYRAATEALVTDQQHGGLTGRRAQDAVLQLQWHLLRRPKGSKTWVIQLDLEKCFNK
eukprot:4044148-Amphidinium_carterae.1